ncbi:UNVERIFIED_CONTAM: hypothetical protein Sindi_2634200 [Sesamum indicum]
MVEYRIGDGFSIYLLQDLWHELGPLIHRFSRGPRLLGLGIEEKLSRVILDRQWHWTINPRYLEYLEILQTVPILHGGNDSIIWCYKDGLPILASLFQYLDPPGPKVGWSSALSGSFKIPRHNFILWLAILEKLSTADKP